MSLQIRPMCVNDLDTVVEMALESYCLERRSCGVLPASFNADYVRKQLSEIIETGTGKLAMEAETPIGFLAFGKPFSVGNSAYGTKSPLFGYGVRHEKRDIIIGKLFQDIAAEVCEKYIESFNLLVTHGTINPNARGFWDKYFSNYAYTMARVIDKDMLGIIERI